MVNKQCSLGHWMLYMPNCGTRDEAGLVPPQLESRAARGSSRESRVVHYVIRTSVRASRRRGLLPQLVSCLYPNCRQNSGAVNYEWNWEGSSGGKELKLRCLLSPLTFSLACRHGKAQRCPVHAVPCLFPLTQKPQLQLYHSAGIFSQGIEHRQWKPWTSSSLLPALFCS